MSTSDAVPTGDSVSGEAVPRALVVDWGGVLTGEMRTAVQSWAEADGVPLDSYVATIRDWMGEPYGVEARLNPIHALERGEITVPDFEQRLAEALTLRTGREFDADGLLSNSWGNDYPRDGWDEMFDVVVISGEVGMRKPEAGIFEHTLELMGLPAAQTVFVDDLRHNVDAAVALGMVGVLHRTYEQTLLELEAIFGIRLS